MSRGPALATWRAAPASPRALLPPRLAAAPDEVEGVDPRDLACRPDEPASVFMSQPLVAALAARLTEPGAARGGLSLPNRAAPTARSGALAARAARSQVARERVGGSRVGFRGPPGPRGAAAPAQF